MAVKYPSQAFEQRVIEMLEEDDGGWLNSWQRDENGLPIDNPGPIKLVAPETIMIARRLLDVLTELGHDKSFMIFIYDDEGRIHLEWSDLNVTVDICAYDRPDAYIGIQPPDNYVGPHFRQLFTSKTEKDIWEAGYTLWQLVGQTKV